MFDGSHTLANTQRDFVEWHRGRSPYVLWALDVDLAPVVARVAAAARHLDGLLLNDYVRQPHVTLNLCGFSGRPSESHDEFDPAALQAKATALASSDVGPFAIRLGGLASFSSAPFLAVEDIDGGIAAVRQCLATPPASDAHGDYVPHVTVGLYAGSWPRGEVAPRLSAFSESEPIDCRIEAVSLMSYDPRVIGGRLSELGRVCLRMRRVVGLGAEFAPA